MLARLRQWRRQRILRRAGIPPYRWQRVLSAIPVCAGLDAPARARLWELASLFLHDKRVEPVHGLQLGSDERATIAAMACLPILNLGLSAYRGWHTVLVYPGAFLVHHRYTDASGLEHAESGPLAGEAWDAGPVVLSWDDVLASLDRDGYNVVLHEFCHKLDMANGEANGYPPLPAGMDRHAWVAAFTGAFEAEARQYDAHEPTALDPYALESPAEFFAVACEAFFECPHQLAAALPSVYQQLRGYFGQDPRQRLPADRCVR